MNNNSEQCISNPELTIDDLWDIVEAHDDPYQHSHIANCIYCQRRIAQLIAFEPNLSKALSRFGCYDPQDLTDFVMNRLDAEKHKLIERHLDTCLACQHETEALQSYLQSADDQIVTQKSEVSLTSVTNFHYVATIQEITGGRNVRGQVRGSVKGPIILNITDDVDIILEHHKSAGRTQIIGNFAVTIIDRWESTLVQVHTDKKLIATTTVDDLGTFKLDLPTDEVFSIRFHQPNGVSITVPRITFDGT